MNQYEIENEELLELLGNYVGPVSPNESQQQALLDYVALMLKWSRAYNLTSVRKPREIIIRHIFDSFSVAPFLEGKRIGDVGSGAGLPGIPLAIMFPEKHFVLLDSNGKKSRFLFHVKQALNLTNVFVVQERVEVYRAAECFDSVVSRAFSSLQDMLLKTKHLCCPEGIFLAMKGAYPMTELEELSPEFSIESVDSVAVPLLDEKRHIVRIRFNQE